MSMPIDPYILLGYPLPRKREGKENKEPTLQKSKVAA